MAMRHTSLSEIPLQHLRLLDLVLDVLFLYSSLLRITPPCRTLILAWNAEIDASTTGWTAFTALFATQATCKATWLKVRYRIESWRVVPYQTETACAPCRSSCRQLRGIHCERQMSERRRWACSLCCSWSFSWRTAFWNRYARVDAGMEKTGSDCRRVVYIMVSLNQQALPSKGI